jgi:hypothetical protein
MSGRRHDANVKSETKPGNPAQNTRAGVKHDKPGKQAKAPHEADIYKAEQIARAVRYNVHFLYSPHDRFNVACATLAEARGIEIAMNEQLGKYGRRAIIYAINPEGQAFPMGGGYSAATAGEPATASSE